MKRLDDAQTPGRVWQMVPENYGEQPLTAMGAPFFWARLVSIPLYTAGVPAERTVAVVAATLGTVLILMTLT